MTMQSDRKRSALTRQDMEASLSEAEAARRAVMHTLESIGECAALITPDGILLETTSAFAQLCEIPREKLIRQPIGVVLHGFHPLERETESAITNTLIDTVQEVQMPVITLQDGSRRWVLPTISNVAGKDGQLAARLLTFRDMTSLKEAQLATEESEQNYRQLVDFANTCILRIDTRFRIRFTNDYVHHLFGHETEALQGSNLLERLVAARDGQDNDQHRFMHQVMEAPETHGSYDQLNTCSDGRRIWLHWSARAIRDERGNVRELLLVGADITRRKQAETAARHYRRRARRLADRLVQQEEESRREIATYLHDQVIQMLSLANIRLGGLRPVLEKAEKPDGTEKLDGVRELLADAIAECRSMMDRLVPSMLYELGLGAALNHLAEKQAASGESRIEIKDRMGSSTLPNERLLILFRSARELIMNALKYAGECRIRVTLEMDGGQAVVTVEDDGVGFDTQRTDLMYYKEGGGYGLFEIQERMDGLAGTLHIESAPGKGTRAVVRIPSTT